MRGMLAGFPTEKIKLIKSNGECIEDIEALVEPKKIFVDDASIIIEEGDIFERKLGNGATEYYEVLDRGFYKGMHGMPDHYQTSVCKTTVKPRTNQIAYNINNGSGKININSTDNSVNVSVTLSSEDEAMFDTIKSVAQTLDNEEKIVCAVDGMKAEVGKKGFLQKYNEFIQAAANHITVFAPFIPMLSKFLVN